MAANCGPMDSTNATEVGKFLENTGFPLHSSILPQDLEFVCSNRSFARLFTLIKRYANVFCDNTDVLELDPESEFKLGAYLDDICDQELMSKNVEWALGEIDKEAQFLQNYLNSVLEFRSSNNSGDTTASASLSVTKAGLSKVESGDNIAQSSFIFPRANNSHINKTLSDSCETMFGVSESINVLPVSKNLQWTINEDQLLATVCQTLSKHYCPNGSEHNNVFKEIERRVDEAIAAEYIQVRKNIDIACKKELCRALLAFEDERKKGTLTEEELGTRIMQLREHNLKQEGAISKIEREYRSLHSQYRSNILDLATNAWVTDNLALLQAKCDLLSKCIGCLIKISARLKSRVILLEKQNENIESLLRVISSLNTVLDSILKQRIQSDADIKNTMSLDYLDVAVFDDASDEMANFSMLKTRMKIKQDQTKLEEQNIDADNNLDAALESFTNSCHVWNVRIDEFISTFDDQARLRVTRENDTTFARMRDLMQTNRLQEVMSQDMGNLRHDLRRDNAFRFMRDVAPSYFLNGKDFMRRYDRFVKKLKSKIENQSGATSILSNTVLSEDRSFAI